MVRARRRSRLAKHVQIELLKYFRAGSTARSAADLTGVNRNTAVLFFHKLREVIFAELAASQPGLMSGEVEADESYFGAGGRARSAGLSGAGAHSGFFTAKGHEPGRHRACPHRPSAPHRLALPAIFRGIDAGRGNRISAHHAGALCAHRQPGSADADRGLPRTGAAVACLSLQARECRADPGNAWLRALVAEIAQQDHTVEARISLRGFPWRRRWNRR